MELKKDTVGMGKGNWFVWT